MTTPSPSAAEYAIPRLDDATATPAIALRRRLLSGFHLGCLILVTTVFLVPAAVLGALVRAFAPRVQARVGAVALWAASRSLVWLIGWRIELRGTPPSWRRRGGVLIATNHTSYMDALMLAALMPSRFVGKSEIGGWPGIGWVATGIGTFFLRRFDRTHVREMKDTIAAALRAGDAVILFPEATTSDGRRLLPFNPALLEAAVEADVPVATAAITYAAEGDARPLHEVVAWWRPVAFGAHLVRLFSVRPAVATLSFNEPLLPTGAAERADAATEGEGEKAAAAGARAARKELARRARVLVAERLAETTPWSADELMRRGDRPEWAPSADRAQLEPED